MAHLKYCIWGKKLRPCARLGRKGRKAGRDDVIPIGGGNGGGGPICMVKSPGIQRVKSVPDCPRTHMRGGNSKITLSIITVSKRTLKPLDPTMHCLELFLEI